MGTSTDFETCSQCGYTQAIFTYQTRTGEWYLECPRCGCYVEKRAITDRKKTALLNDGIRYFRLNKLGEPVYRYISKRGCGAYAIYNTDGYGVSCCFTRPISETDLAEFEKAYNDASTDTSRSYLTAWDESAQTIKVVQGTFVNPLLDPSYLDDENAESATSLQE